MRKSTLMFNLSLLFCLFIQGRLAAELIHCKASPSLQNSSIAPGALAQFGIDTDLPYGVLTPPEITFKQLVQWQELDEDSPLEGSTVSIRGFIYELNGGQWIAAAVPNLKSCCLENVALAGTRVYIEWTAIPAATDRSTLIKGRLYIDKENGQMNFYRLTGAEVIAPRPFSWTFVIFLFCIFILLALLTSYFWRRLKYPYVP